MSGWLGVAPMSAPLALGAPVQQLGISCSMPFEVPDHNSDHSSADAVSLLHLGSLASSRSGSGVPASALPSSDEQHLPEEHGSPVSGGIIRQISGGSDSGGKLAAALGAPPTAAVPRPAAPAKGQARKGQGYRKLWMLVNRVQRGERLSDSTANREDVTVEDLVKMVQQLPASASAVEAITPGLAYLDSRATAALLKGLAKAGLGQRAVEIFDFLRSLDPDHELAPLADIFTYTTMISQCNSHHQLRRALELVAEMRGRAVPLNVHTYSALLNVCLKANELDLSLDVYAQMLAEGVTPNLVTYNTLLDIYNKTGRWVDALNVLELLQHQNIRPEARTYNAIISCCNAAGRYAEAVRVHKVMAAAGVEPNGATFNAALTSYARAGQLEAALSLFGVMGGRGYERGANSYAAVLAACEMPGRWDLALKLLAQMQAEGVRPSTACLTSAISACMHGGQPARAEQLFERMCSVCKPDASTFNCLVCVYCRLGKVREAANMLEVMLRSGQHVDLTTYDAAVEACWATGTTPLQRYARQLYERARGQGLYQLLLAEQVCAEGTLLDLQLPSGPPHVVLLSLLHMLNELRSQAPTLLGPGGRAAKVLVRLAVQGQDAASLSHIITSQLRSLDSPFAAVAPGAAAGLDAELQFVADAPAAAAWLGSADVALVLGQLQGGQPPSGRGVDGLLVCQEDAQREFKCRQALLSVQAFESSTYAISAQGIEPSLLLQRGELVQLLLRAAQQLGLPCEVGHDAVQLLDRVAATSSLHGLATSLCAPLLAAACLHVVSRADVSASPVCGALFGVTPQQLLLAASQVRAALGGRGCISISAMRVLQLLIERLGVDTADEGAARGVAGRAAALMARAALAPAFIGCPPSVLAMSVLYAARLSAGLLPAWPTALASLTGTVETSPALQPCIGAAMQLVLEL